MFCVKFIVFKNDLGVLAIHVLNPGLPGRAGTPFILDIPYRAFGQKKSPNDSTRVLVNLHKMLETLKKYIAFRSRCQRGNGFLFQNHCK